MSIVYIPMIQLSSICLGSASSLGVFHILGTTKRALARMLVHSIECDSKFTGGNFSAYCSHSTPMHHETTRCQLRPRHRVLQASRTVLHQKPTARHPSEDPAHDPAAMQNCDPLGLMMISRASRSSSSSEARFGPRCPPSGQSSVTCSAFFSISRTATGAPSPSWINAS